MYLNIAIWTNYFNFFFAHLSGSFSLSASQLIMLLCVECNSVGVFAFVNGFHGLIFICIDVKMANAKIKRKRKVLKTETIIFMSCINMETQKAHKYFIFYFPFAKVARIKSRFERISFQPWKYLQKPLVYILKFLIHWNLAVSWKKFISNFTRTVVWSKNSIKTSVWLCRSLNIHEPEKKSNKTQCLTKRIKSRDHAMLTREMLMKINFKTRKFLFKYEDKREKIKKKDEVNKKIKW